MAARNAVRYTAGDRLDHISEHARERWAERHPTTDDPERALADVWRASDPVATARQNALFVRRDARTGCKLVALRVHAGSKRLVLLTVYAPSMPIPWDFLASGGLCEGLGGASP